MDKVTVWKVIIASVLSIQGAYACITTFINDKNVRIFIFNEDDKSFISLGKNQKRRLGNQSNNAHFVVYVQHQNGPIFVPKYTCRQYACGINGNVLLKYSELENGFVPGDLFEIITHKPYSSMVDQLPIMQKFHDNY